MQAAICAGVGAAVQRAAAPTPVIPLPVIFIPLPPYEIQFERSAETPAPN